MNDILNTHKNLRMSAEWERQTAVWLAWPHNKADWPDRFGPVEWVYAEMIRYLVRAQRVRLVVKNARLQQRAAALLERHGVDLAQLDFIQAPTDRVWLRDSGPIFVRRNFLLPRRGRDGVGAEGGMTDANEFNSIPTPHSTLRPPPGLPPTGGGDLLALDFRFNAWAKYGNWKRDDKIPSHAVDFLNLPSIRPEHGATRVVLEGGSIDVNGCGTLLTTEECLLSDVQCRNPGFTRADYESVFARYLGAHHVVWLGDGIAGDDTHGHVDDLARFVNPSTVAVVTERDKADANYSRLRENAKRLKQARDQDGKPLEVVELPSPRPIIFDGERLPASYANFLIANEVVLVPVFNDMNDRVALNLLAELFPTRDVIPIYCGDFVWGLGTIHCASQQEPA